MVVDLQRAGMWKRMGAWMFDMILMCILATFCGLLLGVIMNYDAYAAKLDEAYAKYENKYGVVFDISEEEYSKMTPDEQANYQAAYEELMTDQAANEAYTMVMHQTIIMMAIGILVSIFVLEFIVPMIMKNGQTIGKKIFAIGVMGTNYVRLTTMQLFVRSILGKYTIGTMFPIYILLLSFFGSLGITGTFIVAALFFIQAGLLAFHKDHAQLHDLLSGTVVIDLASQHIFESEEARIEYSKKLSAERAANKLY